MTKILFDPGHARKKQGAPTQFPGLNEYDLNLIQARAAFKLLQNAGFELVLFDPADDDLIKIGAQAAGCDAFVSLHLNSCSDPETDYTTVCVHETGSKTESKKLASKIIFALVKTLALKPYRGPFGPGLMYLPLKVLSVAEKACKGPCVLTEAFFVSNATWKTQDEIIRRAEQAGIAIGQAIADYFASAKR